MAELGSSYYWAYVKAVQMADLREIFMKWDSSSPSSFICYCLFSRTQSSIRGTAPVCAAETETSPLGCHNLHAFDITENDHALVVV